MLSFFRRNPSDQPSTIPDGQSVTNSGPSGSARGGRISNTGIASVLKARNDFLNLQGKHQNALFRGNTPHLRSRAFSKDSACSLDSARSAISSSPGQPHLGRNSMFFSRPTMAIQAGNGSVQRGSRRKIHEIFG